MYTAGLSVRGQLQRGGERGMGKLNKSVISVDEEGGMSLKACLSFEWGG